MTWLVRLVLSVWCLGFATVAHAQEPPNAAVDRILGDLQQLDVVLQRLTPAADINHKADVARIKQQVIAAGIDLNHGPGECGRFEITKRVAWELRAEGWGLIAKFGVQNGCSATNTTSEPKYSVDAILLPDGTCRDIIGGGSEGPNTPQWNACTSSASLYRPAFDPGDAPPPPPPPPTGLEPRVAALEQRAANVEKALQELVQDLERQLAALIERVEKTEGTLARIGVGLEGVGIRLSEHSEALKRIQSWPIPVSCHAAVFGIGITCKLDKVINP